VKGTLQVKIRSLLSAAAIWVTTVPVCAGQGAPRELCSSDDSGTTPKLAEIAAAQPTTAYYFCSPGTDCLSATLAPGDPILVWKVEGDWTCGYHEDRHGAAPVWVRSKDIRPLHFDPSPPLDAWLGTWEGGEGHIWIQKSKAPGRLELDGVAQWHGLGDVVHLGNFAGEVSPNGNHVHFVESFAGSCTVDLTLIGKYLVVDDNSACGGMNVRFSGLWKRVGQH
jgi:hypothetical protein